MRISDWSSYVCSSDLLASAQLADRGNSSPHRKAFRRYPILRVSRRGRNAALRSCDAGEADGPAAGRLSWDDVAVVRMARWSSLASSDRIGHLMDAVGVAAPGARRSEEHTSELQSLMRISYAVFCLKKKTTLKTSTC